MKPIEPHLQYWLTSMGYDLTGKTVADVEAILAREAAQWGMSVPELEALAREGYEVHRRTWLRSRWTRLPGIDAS